MLRETRARRQRTYRRLRGLIQRARRAAAQPVEQAVLVHVPNRPFAPARMKERPIGGGARATQTTCVALLVIVVVDVFITGCIAVIGVIGLAMVDLVI